LRFARTNSSCAKKTTADKQGTVGDVQGDQPWAYQFEARAKWDAWNALKGMDKPTAWKKYIELASRVVGPA